MTIFSSPLPQPPRHNLSPLWFAFLRFTTTWFSPCDWTTAWHPRLSFESALWHLLTAPPPRCRLPGLTSRAAASPPRHAADPLGPSTRYRRQTLSSWSKRTVVLSVVVSLASNSADRRRTLIICRDWKSDANFNWRSWGNRKDEIFNGRSQTWITCEKIRKNNFDFLISFRVNGKINFMLKWRLKWALVALVLQKLKCELIVLLFRDINRVFNRHLTKF